MTNDVTQNMSAGRKTNISNIPAPPKTCTSEGCRKDADFLFIRVFIDGANRSGSFETFGKIKGRGANKVMMLNEGVEFKKWIARCGGCYAEDVERAGLQRIKTR